MNLQCLLISSCRRLEASLSRVLPEDVELMMVAEPQKLEPGAALVLVDCRNDPHQGWSDSLKCLRQSADQALPVIAVCRPEAPSLVHQALEQGADSYLFTPLQKNETSRVIELCLSGARSDEVFARRLPADDILLTEGFCGFVGASESMKKVYSQLLKVGAADSSVLIRGESGTGKEVAARALHQLGRRSGRPFVPVNCGAIPRDLLESELFGYVKGAFTGAHQDRLGRIEMANGGSVFLDEIGDMEALLQVKILRLLQERTIEPLGWQREPKKVDVRIISATNRDLEKEIEANNFREDLYYRLNVVTITLPPLRERPADIAGLADCFLRAYNQGFAAAEQVAGVTPEAMWLLERYNWPGNVRELENVIERAAVMQPGGWIMPRDLPAKVMRGVESDSREEKPDPFRPRLPAEGISLKSEVTRLEKELIAEALQRSQGVKEQAARLLKINRTTLIEKIRRNRLEEEAT